MTDSEIDAIATGILLRANDEKWYEQKERIKKAVFGAYVNGVGYGVRESVALMRQGYEAPNCFQSSDIPRDFVPGHRQVNEEG